MGDDGKETTAKVARWLGFVASCCTISIGLARIFTSGASLSWPNNNFTSDVNEVSWRFRLFTFAPDPFADVWTPMVMGVLGVFAHLKGLDRLEKITTFISKNFTHYFLWHFLSYMFGGIGYQGGWGIIFSIPSILAAILSFALIFFHNVSAKLDLEAKFSAKFEAKEQGDCKDFAKVTRWFGFVAAMCAIITGFVHVITIGASIRWPKYIGESFFDDVNILSWRFTLFTFAPNTFVDCWTPIIMGILGTIPHFQMWYKHTERFVKDFIAYFIFHLVLALWGIMGYAGGVGIILCIPAFLTALFSFILIFAGNEHAGLKLKFKWSAQFSGDDGANASGGN
eukprot:GHVP01066889.1.p1 GENE.GHVP01066889.1~~GHVP01066889.1.p1  ORF type:complete len:339 (+),score=38.97 GHVP01066889.1:490-1506(+)